MVFGEITTKAPLDYDKIVRETCQGIGYDVFEEDLASARMFDACGVFLIVVEGFGAKRGAGPMDGRRAWDCDGCLAALLLLTSCSSRSLEM